LRHFFGKKRRKNARGGRRKSSFSSLKLWSEMMMMMMVVLFVMFPASLKKKWFRDWNVTYGAIYRPSEMHQWQWRQYLKERRHWAAVSQWGQKVSSEMSKPPCTVLCVLYIRSHLLFSAHRIFFFRSIIT
jgi:hypothetical protein